MMGGRAAPLLHLDGEGRRSSRGVARALAVRFVAVAAVGASAVGALVPIAAWAQGGRAEDPKPHPTPPARPPATSAEACAQGNAKYQAHDLPAATALYRKALELDASDPVAHYLLGEALLAAGNIADAEAEWSRASALTGERDPSARARILFVLADLKERQWKWNEATTAWGAYADLADRFPDAGGMYPGSAKARLAAIAAMLKQDRAYEVVRRRIAEDKDGGVSTDLSK